MLRHGSGNEWISPNKSDTIGSTREGRPDIAHDIAHDATSAINHRINHRITNEIDMGKDPVRPARAWPHLPNRRCHESKMSREIPADSASARTLNEYTVVIFAFKK